MKEIIRNDRVTRITKDDELQVPIGHYALITRHNNPNNNPHNSARKMSIYGLGSCIALILYDRVKEVSAMSHILLPEVKKTKVANPRSFPHKYANHSVKELLNQMLRHGATRKNMKAAIIGGADIFKRNSLEMGKENTLAVKRELDSLSIRLEKEVTGGTKGRVIIYDFIENSISVKVTGVNDFTKTILK